MVFELESVESRVDVSVGDVGIPVASVPVVCVDGFEVKVMRVEETVSEGDSEKCPETIETVADVVEKIVVGGIVSVRVSLSVDEGFPETIDTVVVDVGEEIVVGEVSVRVPVLFSASDEVVTGDEVLETDDVPGSVEGVVEVGSVMSVIESDVTIPVEELESTVEGLVGDTSEVVGVNVATEEIIDSEVVDGTEGSEESPGSVEVVVVCVAISVKVFEVEISVKEDELYVVEGATGDTSEAVDTVTVGDGLEEDIEGICWDEVVKMEEMSVESSSVEDITEDDPLPLPMSPIEVWELVTKEELSDITLLVVGAEVVLGGETEESDPDKVVLIILVVSVDC
ncbi:hypothetical protein C8R42DRAFT_645081 [Lentinula raphanica]|nr:hypothetical protein C8R42DRAFT_645081 [Lentinula raphanica]